MWGDREPAEVKQAMEAALTRILDATEIPAANAVQCGNYRDLSLFGAKEYAKAVLATGFSLNIYGDAK
jgi:S-ribosylhomocysteine lyase